MRVAATIDQWEHHKITAQTPQTKNERTRESGQQTQEEIIRMATIIIN